jgi:lipopolysaccharide/colanic/teichoic acid biosynthesis glycosyltransferase
MKYIDNRGTLLDTKILLKTIRTVLQKSGAY